MSHEPERLAVVGSAFADGTSDRLHRDTVLLIEDGWVAQLWQNGAGPDPGDLNARVVDASGSTMVPGFVDSHAHLTMQGGAQWIARGLDPPAELMEIAEDNGAALVRSGVRWARDAGARRGPDGRALNVTLRERWQGRPERPYVRAAGTWISRSGVLPPTYAIEIAHGADLVDAVTAELDAGADLVKLYLYGPDPDTSPFSAGELAAAVAAAHGRGARVAAHSSAIAGAAAGAAAGIDSLEHGFELDSAVADTLARNRVTLVSTLSVPHSWRTFAATTTIDRFSSDDGAARVRERLEIAELSVRLAHAAGVAIAAGSDFGGGSPRAGHLAWEAEALVKAGLEPYEALAAITWRGGELYGDRAAGRITVGAPAHFSLVHGDPLSEAASLWRIWKTY